jgi:hypothetical protein
MSRVRNRTIIPLTTLNLYGNQITEVGAKELERFRQCLGTHICDSIAA